MSENIFQDGVLVDLNISYWSGAKILNPDDLGLDPASIAEAYKLGKKMLIPVAVIHAFRLIESRARALLDKNSFRFPLGTARFVPKACFHSILSELKGFQSDYNKLTAELIEKYDQYREQMLPIYAHAADQAYANQKPALDADPLDPVAFKERFMNRIASYYPPVDTLRGKFGIDWSVYEIAMPRLVEADAEKLSADSAMQESVNKEYRAQMQAKMSDFVSDVVKVLRSETVELCNQVTTSITEGKIIRTGTVEKLKGFIDRFSSLNFVGDTKIESALDGLRTELLNAYPASKILDSDDLKGELKRRLVLISEAASEITDVSAITGEYKRKIVWE